MDKSRHILTKEYKLNILWTFSIWAVFLIGACIANLYCALAENWDATPLGLFMSVAAVIAGYFVIFSIKKRNFVYYIIIIYWGCALISFLLPLWLALGLFRILLVPYLAIPAIVPYFGFTYIIPYGVFLHIFMSIITISSVIIIFLRCPKQEKTENTEKGAENEQADRTL